MKLVHCLKNIYLIAISLESRVSRNGEGNEFQLLSSVKVCCLREKDSEKEKRPLENIFSLKE